MAPDSWIPALDVYEAEDTLELTLDLPGIDPAAVELTVEDSSAPISGVREFRSDVSEENYRRVERRYGSFARSSLTPTADAEGIRASFDEGVLTIEVPKREEARKPRRSRSRHLHDRRGAAGRQRDEAPQDPGHRSAGHVPRTKEAARHPPRPPLQCPVLRMRLRRRAMHR